MTLTWKHLQRKTLLKLTNTKKLNNTSSTDNKTYIKITKINKYKKTEQHFHEGAQSRTQLHFDEPNNKHSQIQQRSNEPQNSPRKRLTKMFNQQLTSIRDLYL